MDKTDASIDYPAGVEMTPNLTAALDRIAPVEASKLRDIGPADALVALVNAEPFRTFTGRTNKPFDIANIMFPGTEAPLTDARYGSARSTHDGTGDEIRTDGHMAVIEFRSR